MDAPVCILTGKIIFELAHVNTCHVPFLSFDMPSPLLWHLLTLIS